MAHLTGLRSGCRWRVWIAGVVWLVATLTAGGQEPAEPVGMPFRPGEILTYKLGWGPFEVGTAEMTIATAEHNGQPTLLVTLVARTNSFADRFYKVRNTTRSWLHPDLEHTIHYLNQQNEGDRQREIMVSFDWTTPAVQYTNLLSGESRDPVPLTDGTFDPLGITYFVRSLPLVVGETLQIPTTNGRELFTTEVQVKEVVERDFALGRLEVFVLEPSTKDLGGVFRKSSDATITFWFSTDARRLPVRMESSVRVGSFWAELVKVERPGEATQEEVHESRRARRGAR